MVVYSVAPASLRDGDIETICIDEENHVNKRGTQYNKSLKICKISNATSPQVMTLARCPLHSGREVSVLVLLV